MCTNTRLCILLRASQTLVNDICPTKYKKKFLIFSKTMYAQETTADALPSDVRQALRKVTETYASMCTRAGLRIVDGCDDSAPDTVTVQELEEPAARLQARFLKSMAAAKARMATISPSDLTPPMPAMYRAYLACAAASTAFSCPVNN